MLIRAIYTLLFIGTLFVAETASYRNGFWENWYRQLLRRNRELTTQASTTRSTSTAAPKVLSDSITNFSIALYQEAEPDGEKYGNKFISPFSVLAALMFTMLGTAGNTERELMAALRLTGVSNGNIHTEYNKLQTYLNNALSNDVTLAIANRLFPKLGITLNPSYERNALNLYDSEVEALDFEKKAEESRVRINQWASNKTNNLIKEILPKGIVNKQSIMFLVNAIYFKGDWKLQFDKKETRERDFYISPDVTKKTDMMNIDTNKHRSGINQQLNCKVLELPYKGNKISMLLILPDQTNNITNLEKQLSADTLKSLYSSLRKQRTIISIPKFEMRSKFSLVNPLKELGITDLFIPSSADFSGMFLNPLPDLHVSGVIQKSYVKVDEEGTEAAAVTGIVISVTSVQIPGPMTFIANRPFLFVIRENESGTILFMGRYTKP